MASDTHWTPEAVEEIAGRLGDFITKETKLPTIQQVSYTRLATAVNGIGDTALMLDFPKGKDAQYRSTVMTHKVQFQGNTWKSDKSADILFMGDSFSNIYSVKGMGWGESAGLAEQLSYQLKRPIDKISINAGGSYATREDLKRQLTRNPNRLDGKRVVVYEFAARELSSGDWKVIDLPLPKLAVHKPTAPKTPLTVPVEPKVEPITPLDEEPIPAPETAVSPKPGLSRKPIETPVKPKVQPAKPVNNQIVVQATVAAKSESPTPGTVAYADCVIALHLKNISVKSGKMAPKEIVVFIWGMRQNKLMPAASYRIGQRVTLKLKPWDSAESTFGSYNRVELDDDNLLMLDIFWGDETK
jgi:alginate O-acetyltransferase complex protein AlgJ